MDSAMLPPPKPSQLDLTATSAMATTTITKKKPRPMSILDRVDRQIGDIKKNLLPALPHLLHVDIKHPYNGGYPHEFEGTPFENHEVKDLQYMTMISDGCRGVADTKGDWQDEINSRSPSVVAARSNTATPNAGREGKGPVKKISFGAYKNKKAGITTTPQPGASDPARPAHSRNVSEASISTPMNRVPSFDGAADVKTNGASLVAIATENAASKSIAQNYTSSEPKTKVASSVNAHDQPSKGSLQTKDSNKSVQPSKPSTTQLREPLKNGLPPRPQSPARNGDRKPPTSEPKQVKRPLESADTPPEKRAKATHDSTPSDTDSSRRPETLPDKKHQDSPLKPSSQPSKTISSSKQAENKDSIKLDKPLKMPRLLSPLPADLETISAPIPKVKISGPDSSSTNNSPKPKLGKDTIRVKPSLLNTSSPKTSSSPYSLPRLLSPTLPPEVEDELLRIQQKKSTSSSSNGVEARHENARRPDAPGVARKMPKSAKKTVVEASKSLPVVEKKESLIVKLKYKKRKANDIARILKLQSRPSKQFLSMEKENTARPKPKVESEDDTPAAPIIKPKPAAAAPKKCPSDSYESRPLESASKRPKITHTADVPEARPAVTVTPASQAKSPLPSAPSQKNLLVTPKKSEAIKSVAMRKIDSHDGNARTPQPAAVTSTPTPASAEKPRVNGNGDGRASAEHEKLSKRNKDLDAQALKLKRKMDDLLQTKAQGPSSIPESQRTQGLCVGMECIVMYLQSFAAGEALQKKRNSTAWEGGLRLWVFVDNLIRQYRNPVLSALSNQMGAVIKEELGRVYLGLLGEHHADPRFLDSLRRNHNERDKLWKMARESRGDLEGLGVKEVTGPWTGIEDITKYTIKVLEQYARKEKTGWSLSN